MYITSLFFQLYGSSIITMIGLAKVHFLWPHYFCGPIIFCGPHYFLWPLLFFVAPFIFCGPIIFCGPHYFLLKVFIRPRKQTHYTQVVTVVLKGEFHIFLVRTRHIANEKYGKISNFFFFF